MADRWFWYKLGYWEIAVNAINKHDADYHIRIHANGAKFQGEYPPPPNSVASGMVTTKREAQIRALNEMEEEAWEREGCPGKWR